MSDDLRLKVVFMGSPEFSVLVLAALLDATAPFGHGQWLEVAFDCLVAIEVLQHLLAVQAQRT